MISDHTGLVSLRKGAVPFKLRFLSRFLGPVVSLTPATVASGLLLTD